MAFTAYIFKEDFSRLTEDYTRGEGGSLFGQWTSTGNPVVHVATSSRLPKRQGMTTYLSNSFKECHIGEWRPVMTGQSNYNANDSRAREELLSKYSGQETPARFLVLDVNRAKIVPFLFEKRIPKGQGNLEILSGENPFNRALTNPQQTLAIYQHQAATAGQEQWNPSHTRSQEARTEGNQWYSGDNGNRNLQAIFQQFQSIARMNKVEMSRDTQTHDISMSFTDDRHYNKWEVKFTSAFPLEGALLIDKNQPAITGHTRSAAGYQTSYGSSFGQSHNKPGEKQMPGSESMEKAVKNIISFIKSGKPIA